jgi:hypothetical protein
MSRSCKIAWNQVQKRVIEQVLGEFINSILLVNFLPLFTLTRKRTENKLRQVYVRCKFNS